MTSQQSSSNNSRKGPNPHFFTRDADGSVRFRMRLDPEEAALIEEGAGTTPLMLYMHRVLVAQAKLHIRKRAEDLERRGITVDSLLPNDDDDDAPQAGAQIG